MQATDETREEYRLLVETALDRALPPANCRPTQLHAAMRYAVLGGGKRIRPMLCLAAAKAIGADPMQAMPAAVALELLHTYTLVHDDLPSMDDDDLRRGRPTVHRQFSEALAILTGDALQALAFETIARSEPPLPFTAAHMVAVLASAAGASGVVGGQTEDIAPPTPLDPETLSYVHYHKTAILFRASTRLGAMAAGADDNQLGALSDFGADIGLTFQIVDDLLDAPPSGVTHVPTSDGVTCLNLHSVADARALARRHLNRALDRLKSTHDIRAEFLLALASELETRTV